MVKTTQHGFKVSPPVNCGVYFFSVRVYEEFGLSTRTTAGGDGESLTFGNSTPKESVKSGASSLAGELAKYFS